VPVGVTLEQSNAEELSWFKENLPSFYKNSRACAGVGDLVTKVGRCRLYHITLNNASIYHVVAGAAGDVHGDGVGGDRACAAVQTAPG
jgi:hypothetical protein